MDRMFFIVGLIATTIALSVIGIARFLTVKVRQLREQH